MPGYNELVMEIHNNSTRTFVEATERLIAYVGAITRTELSGMLLDIGAIPQNIKPSSSEEKLYSKATDIVLARCFAELGLNATVLEARGNSADVEATSMFHGYSLVADSKAMRLSRTAKNQKDFKVGALGDNWIGTDSTYAVLCCPLYQYPVSKSQIYEQALNNKTCFFSWEYIKFLIDNNVRESNILSLEPIWSYAVRLSRVAGINRQENYLGKIEETISSRTSLDINYLRQSISSYYQYIAARADVERNQILTQRISEINSMSRDEAISLLIEQETKKTETMDKLISRLQ